MESVSLVIWFMLHTTYLKFVLKQNLLTFKITANDVGYKHTAFLHAV